MPVPSGLWLKFRLDIKPDARRTLERAPQILIEELRRALELVLQIVKTEIRKQISSIHLIDTGRLRNSIHGEVISVTARSFRGEVAPNGDVVYASIHERGGRIVPKNGRVLVWTDKGVDRPAPGDKEGWKALRKQGVVHVARSVTIQAKHYMRDGLQNAKPRIKGLFSKAVARAWVRIIQGKRFGGED